MMHKVTHYRLKVSPEMWNEDGSITHAEEYGTTLCGYRHDAPAGGYVSRHGWERKQDGDTRYPIDCKRCLSLAQKRHVRL